VPSALCPPGQQVEIGLGLKLVRISRLTGVNADGEMSEIAEVELTRHRVVASSADTVRRCFRQILAGWAIATKLCGILGRWTWTEPRFKSLHLL
jgi:hypothetical protein